MGAGAVVLVDGRLDPVRRDALWRALRSGRGLEQLLDELEADASTEPPAFGFAIRVGDRVRIQVRAGVTVIVRDASGQARTIDTAAVSTRVEYLAGNVRGVTLGRLGAPEAVDPLPLDAGVVAADSVDWVAPMVAVVFDAVDPAPAQAEPRRPGLSRFIESVPTPHPHAGAERALAAADPPAKAPMLPEPARSPVDSIPPIDPTDAAGDHDGHTISRSAVAVMRAGSPRATVSAVYCEALHANPPEAAACRTCGEPLSIQEPVQIPQPTLGFLRFSTGQLVALDRRVVVGRSPSVERVSGGDLPEIVQLDSPDQDISRNHAEIRVEGWQALIIDLESINGTMVTLADGYAERLHPHEPFVLVPGAVVDLAGEVTFQYELRP